MNLKLLIPSFFIIIITHYILFTYEFKKKTISNSSIPTTFQKVTLHMAKLEKPKEIKKVEKKEIIKKKIETKKSVVKKEKYIKPIVKEKVVKRTVEKKVKEVKPVNQPTTKSTKKLITKTQDKPVNKIDEETQKQINYYLSKLKNLINKNKRYPKISRRLNEQGKVVISFKLLKSGLIKNVRIVRTSGKNRLDKAALNTVKDIKQFLPIPDKFNKNSFDLTIPMKFELK